MNKTITTFVLAMAFLASGTGVWADPMATPSVATTQPAVATPAAKSTTMKKHHRMHKKTAKTSTTATPAVAAPVLK